MHNIHYIVCAENVNRKSVMTEISNHAKADGDGYSSKFTWHDNIPPYESQEKAEEAIKMLDRCWYDDHAVRFFDLTYSKADKTAKIKEYEEKVAQLAKDKAEYEKTHSVRNRKEQYIGCSNCGSKLNTHYMGTNQCPLCRTELRSKTTLDKIQWYKDKILDYSNRIEAEKMKQKKKAVVKWLIKYEYHS